MCGGESVGIENPSFGEIHGFAALLRRGRFPQANAKGSLEIVAESDTAI